MNKKGEIDRDIIIYIIAGIVVIAIFVGWLVLVRNKSGDQLAFIKNLFKFGRG